MTDKALHFSNSLFGNEKMLAYVYDFLSISFEDKILKERIKEIILFGSVAKKSYDKWSDIDLFFVVKNKDDFDDVEVRLKLALTNFEAKADKTWGLKNIKLPISFIVGSFEDKTWENLRDEIISSGILLYGPYKEMPKDINHYFLFYYSLSSLNRKNKMKFIRRLFGYSLKKGAKEYKQKGMLEDINGTKLASNVILIPSENIIKMKKIFNEFKIKYKIMETWIRL